MRVIEQQMAQQLSRGGGKMSEFSGQKLLINQEDHCQVCPARPPQEHQLEGEAVGASV